MRSESRISDFKMIDDYDPFEEFDTSVSNSNKVVLTHRFNKANKHKLKSNKIREEVKTVRGHSRKTSIYKNMPPSKGGGFSQYKIQKKTKIKSFKNIKIDKVDKIRKKNQNNMKNKIAELENFKLDFSSESQTERTSKIDDEESKILKNVHSVGEDTEAEHIMIEAPRKLSSRCIDSSKNNAVISKIELANITTKKQTKRITGKSSFNKMLQSPRSHHMGSSPPCIISAQKYDISSLNSGSDSKYTNSFKLGRKFENN